MRIWVVLLAVTACKQTPPDWKLRTGPDFAIEGPYPAQMIHTPMPGAVNDTMTIYQYASTDEYALQVQVAEMPKTAVPLNVITAMRDSVAKKGTITKEGDVAMGEGGGKDLQFLMDLPGLGKAKVRDRIVMQRHQVYQVMFAERLGVSGHEADGDRFVDSFKLTGQPLDMKTAVADYAGSNAPPIEIEQAGSGTPESDGWYTAHSAAGRFTVRLPGPITEAKSDLGDEGMLYMVSTVQLPERIKLSVACVDGSKKGTSFDEIAAEPGATRRDVHGHRAVETVQGNAIGMFVERSTGLCALSVDPVSATTPRPDADAHKMFDSFTLE